MTAIAAAQEMQQSASDPAAHVWVSASAGSGKTTVLVARLLRLLLGTDDTPPIAPHRILCLTYTKAAAMEMRVRLEKLLGEWATIEETKLNERLTALLAIPPTQKIRDRARALFARISDDPQGPRIQTIHAFCQSVLARFPMEAGISPGFAALDETQVMPLLSSALETVWRTDDSPAWQKAKTWIGARYGIEQLSGILFSLVRHYPDTADAITRAGGEDAYWQQCFVHLNAPENAAQIWHDAFLDTSLPMGFLRSWLRHNPNEKLASFMAMPAADRMASRDDYLSLFLTQEGEPRKTIYNKDIKKLLRAHEIEASLAEQDRIYALMQKSKDQKLALASAAMTLCTARVLKAYQAIKTERGALDFADLITITQNLLADPTMGAWVHYRLDGGIDHILLDEAQDTAPQQWQIVRTLSSEFFAGAGQTDRPRSLFVVGDPKQSIYSFQGANAALFHALQDDFSTRASDAHVAWRTVPLSHSFRTAQNLLTVVDDTFIAQAQKIALSGSDSAIQHFAADEDRAGAVRIYPPELSSKKTRNDGLALVKDHDENLSSSTRLAKKIASQISHWLKAGRQTAGTKKPVAAKDILILLQQRTGFADALRDALRACGVPVMGTDRLKLLDNAAVRDLLCFCQFLLLPEDDLNLAILLRSPFINLDEAMMGEIAATRRRDENLFHALQHHPQTQTIRDYLQTALAAADRRGVYETLSAILLNPCPAAHSGRAALHARMGTECDDPVNELLQLSLREGTASAPLGLQSFLAWVRNINPEIKRDMAQHTENAVRILTVHGAKGLEAPVVILADASEIPGKTERTVRGDTDAPPFLFAPDKSAEGPAFDRGEMRTGRAAEHQRLLYVAMTRASHELHVFGKANAKGEMKAGNWYEQILAAVQRQDAWSDETGIWYCGAEDYFAANTPVSTKPMTANENPWLVLGNANTMPIITPRAVTALLPDYETTAPSADPFARPRGTLMHRLFELLPTVPMADQSAAAARFLSRQLPELPAPLRSQWVAEVLRTIHAPETAAFFGADARAEVSISGYYQNIPVVGTVDRLYITPSEIGILDFKTGEHPAGGHIPPNYAHQLQIYAHLLSGIYPGRKIRAGILWTTRNHWQEMDEGILSVAA